MKDQSAALTACSLLGQAAALFTLFDGVKDGQFWIQDCVGRYRAMNRA